MKHVTTLALLATLILPMAIASLAHAQEANISSAFARRDAIAIELSSPEDLIGSGWEQTLSGAYFKTLEDGVVVEITHGDLARQVALEALDTNIEALRAVKERDVLQDAQLLELLLKRDKFATDDPAKQNKSENLCDGVGTAFFDYSLDQDFAYVFANANTVYVRWMAVGSALSQTWVELNGLVDYGWSSGSTLTVPSWAGWSMPTWTCSGYFKGMVTLSGVPSCTTTTATFFKPFGCY